MDVAFPGFGRHWFTYYDRRGDLVIVTRAGCCRWYHWWPAWVKGVLRRCVGI